MLANLLTFALAVSGVVGVLFSGWRMSVRRACLAIAIVASGLLTWSLTPVHEVASSATRTAGADRYCLQVADPKQGYRPALGWLDLSRLEMRSRGRWQYHGLLVVQRADDWTVYNWSNRRRAWDPVPAMMHPTPLCVPRRGYADRLGLLPDRSRLGQPKGMFARIRRRSYLFPAAFQASAHEGEPASIFFRASGPDFRPLKATASKAEARHGTVGVEFGSRDWLESVARTEEITRALPRPGSKPSLDPASYLERDEQGRVRTLITCPVRATTTNPAPCQHRFYADGGMWTFRQTMADLPNWRALEIAFRRRVDGFERDGQQALTD